MKENIDLICKRVVSFLKCIADNNSQVARKIGVTSAALHKIKSGVNRPSMQTALLLQYTYGLNPEWLFEGKNPMFLELHTEESKEINIEEMEQLEIETFKNFIARIVADRTLSLEENISSLRDEVKSIKEEMVKLKGLDGKKE